MISNQLPSNLFQHWKVPVDMQPQGATNAKINIFFAKQRAHK